MSDEQTHGQQVSFEGMTDPVEILRHLHQSRVLSPTAGMTMEEVYAALRPAEAARMVEIALELCDVGEVRQAEDIALSLSAFTDYDLTPLLQVWVTRGSFREGLVFRRMPPELRDHLIRQVTPSKADYSRLTALAWLGDDCVVRQFQQWHRQQPAGNYPQFAYQAGWELSAQGTRNNLYWGTCYPLYHRTAHEQTPVVVASCRCAL